MQVNKGFLRFSGEELRGTFRNNDALLMQNQYEKIIRANERGKFARG